MSGIRLNFISQMKYMWKMRQLTDYFNMILKEFIIVPYILKQVLVQELSDTLYMTPSDFAFCVPCYCLDLYILNIV